MHDLMMDLGETVSDLVRRYRSESLDIAPLWGTASIPGSNMSGIRWKDLAWLGWLSILDSLGDRGYRNHLEHGVLRGLYEKRHDFEQ